MLDQTRWTLLWAPSSSRVRATVPPTVTEQDEPAQIGHPVAQGAPLIIGQEMLQKIGFMFHNKYRNDEPEDG